MTRGNTAMAFARARRFRGIALSGTCMIASNAFAALADCSAAFLTSFSSASFERACGERPVATIVAASAAAATNSLCVVAGFMIDVSIPTQTKSIVS